MAHAKVSLGKAFSVDCGICFTDSKVALYWVQGVTKEWKQFVHNQVTKICELVPVTSWSHCPGKDNPADLPSHGISPRELQSSEFWLHGSPWLPTMSPQQSDNETDMPEECIVELKGSTQFCYLNSTILPS